MWSITTSTYNIEEGKQTFNERDATCESASMVEFMQQGNRVFVLNMRGEPLMPTTQRKARILLKAQKAKIVKYNPFTIQLKYPTGESKQNVNIGVDTGAKHVGLAIISEDKVLYKAEIELRQDISSNLTTRHMYRRSRRNRKTRYRKTRFLNRKRDLKWLPPSLQSRVDKHFWWIDKFVTLVPNAKLHIEVGKFDTAKMINPKIQGVDYQHGQTYGFYEERYFVFARDNYTCQVCGKSKDKILHTHHIVYRSNGGTNRVDNLITVCTDCHTNANHKPGGILFKWQKEHKKVRQYKEPPFMNILRRRIFTKYPDADITYGSTTTPRRKELGLEKTHYNDAIVISGIQAIAQNPAEWLLIKQFRKKKRSLHEATARKGRKQPNRTAKRNSKNTPYYKGFYLNDKVAVLGKIGHITGFASSGAYIKDMAGNYITLPGKSYKVVGLANLQPICHNNNWQFAAQTIT